MEKKKSKKTEFSEKSYEKKMETFVSMMDKAVLSYPNLIKRSIVSGLFTGLGATVGVALVFIILTLLFKVLGEVPLVGYYAQQISEQVDKVNPANKVK